MLEITTELLGHYLRATGTQYDRAKLAALIAKDGIEEAAFMYLDIDGIFRLGLCAAAERAFCQGREFRAIHQGVWAMKSDDLAVDYLTSAGINPAAWESARKR